MRRHAVILAAAFAWFISIESAEAKLDILVDKATQHMLVIQDGYVRYMWPVSTGRDNMATPNGVYAPQRLERSWFSRAYYNSPMPFSIFFHNGYAIHGSHAIDKLGGPASHGCVRLHPYHAELLFDLVEQEGPNQTTIEITDEARPDEPPSTPGRAIAAATGQGPYPPSPRVIRYRDAGEIPGEPPPTPGRAIATATGQGPYMPPPHVIRYRDTGETPGEPSPTPGRAIATATGQGPYMPPPRVIRYRDTGDTPAEMPEPAPIPRGNRPLVARVSLPPRPPSPPLPAPAPRRVLADVRPPADIRPPATVRPPANIPTASVPRARCGEADPASGSSRGSDEASDCRPKPKIVEAAPPERVQPPPPERVQQAPAEHAQQAAPPDHTQQAAARSLYGFKLLPASCWSGGASRWRAFASSAACR
jgi:hypothetical protein